jgi:probable selenium-dependent hydroxylase accessory protein YqeC
MLSGGGVVSLVGAGGKTRVLFRLARELADRGEAALLTTTTRMMLPAREECPSVVISPDPRAILVRAAMERGTLFAAAAPADGPRKVRGFSPEAVDGFGCSGLRPWVLVEADGAARRPLKAPAAHEPVIPASSRWVVAVVGLDAVGRPLEEAWVFRAERFSRITGLEMGSAVSPRSVADILLHEEGLFRGCPARALRTVFLNQADVPGGLEAAKEIMDWVARQGRGRLHGIAAGHAAQPPPVCLWRYLQDGGEER